MECENCKKLLRELPDKWFKKGQMSVKRKNKSGCCCIIDENEGDKVVSVCGAHAQWLEEQLMNWKSISKDGYPEIGKRVLTYSALYGDDDVNTYRLIDAQFVKICTDITHWSYLEKPE